MEIIQKTIKEKKEPEVDKLLSTPGNYDKKAQKLPERQIHTPTYWPLKQSWTANFQTCYFQRKISPIT